MPIPQKKVPIKEICRILEISVSLWTFNSQMNIEQAEQCIQKFKDIVKKQRKQLAKKYHPDKTGGDDSKIKEINNMVDIVMKLKITKRPQPKTVHFHFTSNPMGGPFHNSSFTGSYNFKFTHIKYS